MVKTEDDESYTHEEVSTPCISHQDLRRVPKHVGEGCIEEEKKKLVID